MECSGRQTDSSDSDDNDVSQEQEETRRCRPCLVSPVTITLDSDDDDEMQEPTSSSRNDDDDLPLNIRGRNAPVDEEFEFLRTHASHVDEGILQTLYYSESDNPNRLESILVEVLGLENAIASILEFRRMKNSGQMAGPSNIVEEQNRRMELMNRIEEMFPDANNLFITRRCRRFTTEEEFIRFINNTMIPGRYPKTKRTSRAIARTWKNRADTTLLGDIDISSDSDSDSDSSSNAANNNDNENEITSSGLVDDDIVTSARKKRKYDFNVSESLPSTSRGLSSEDMAIPSTSRGHPYNLRNFRGRRYINSSQCLHWYRSRCLIRKIKKMNKLAARLKSTRRYNEYYSFFALPSQPTDSSSSEDDEYTSDPDTDSDRDTDVSSSGSQSENVTQNDITPQCSKAGISSPEKSEEPAVVPMDTEDEEMVDGDNAEENENLIPEDPEEWVSKYTAELIALFPKTDPSYLREQCIGFEGSLEIMNKFIIEKLENNDMPEKRPPGQGKATAEVWMQYTENFTPESYLKRIPDPWTRFNNAERDGQKYKLLSEWYLKTKFRNQYVRVINKVLKNNKYNLYLSYRALLRRRRARCCPRKDYECHANRPTTIDMPFLEEMTFIENESEIEKYINDKEMERLKKIEEARASGSMMECQCCFDNEVIMEDMIFCPENHGFCKGCITKYVEIELGQGKCKFSCLNSCDKDLSVTSLQKALKPELFLKVSQMIQLEEVKAAEIEDLVQCPFCTYATVMPPEFKVLECRNPECMKESCRLCREPSHIPLRCDEVEKSDEVKMRTYIENKMTEALVRTCYKCRKSFMKEDGCNKMQCSCGAKMCYVCRQPITNYSHFNGQGANDQSKCPLYTTNDELHVDLVQRVAELAKAEVLQRNPNKKLMHDPTMYLPTRTLQQNLPGAQHGAALAVGLEIVMGIPREVALAEAQPAGAAAAAAAAAAAPLPEQPAADPLPEQPAADLPADDNARHHNNNNNIVRQPRQRRQARPRRRAADPQMNFIMRRLR